MIEVGDGDADDGFGIEAVAVLGGIHHRFRDGRAQACDLGGIHAGLYRHLLDPLHRIPLAPLLTGQFQPGSAESGRTPPTTGLPTSGDGEPRW